jgi:rare lipoprotein A
LSARPDARAVIRAAALAMLAGLLGACAGGAVRPGADGPPVSAGGVDLARVPDAVPRAEPLCVPCQRPYEVGGRRYVPLPAAAGYRARGIASWYGRKFHGRATATGERYDMYAMSAAHPLLPLPSYAEVVNLANGRRVVVRMNDRGPFHAGRLVDLSYAAAARLDMLGAGSAPVEVRVLAEPLGLAGAAPAVSAGQAAVLQAGAFARAVNADALARRLEAAGFGPVEIVTAGGLHRVRLRLPDATRERAARAYLTGLGLPAQRVADAQ